VWQGLRQVLVDGARITAFFFRWLPYKPIGEGKFSIYSNNCIHPTKHAIDNPHCGRNFRNAERRSGDVVCLERKRGARAGTVLLFFSLIVFSA
jgi:hypothetical protein